jgi:hypothetical protein
MEVGDYFCVPLDPWRLSPVGCPPPGCQLFAAIPGINVITATIDGCLVRYTNDLPRLRAYMEVRLVFAFPSLLKLCEGCGCGCPSAVGRVRCALLCMRGCTRGAVSCGFDPGRRGLGGWAGGWEVSVCARRPLGTYGPLLEAWSAAVGLLALLSWPWVRKSYRAVLSCPMLPLPGGAHGPAASAFAARMVREAPLLAVASRGQRQRPPARPPGPPPLLLLLLTLAPVFCRRSP